MKRNLFYAVMLLLAAPHAASSSPQDQAYAQLESAGLNFIQASPYQLVDADSLADRHYYSSDRFPHAPDPQSTMSLPDADLDSMTRAILLLEAKEAALPHVRYRITFSHHASTEFPEITHDYVEVTRYNLGPTRHADLQTSVPAEHLAPVEEFGAGPHVSWRFVMAPVMGSRAALMHASRREIPQQQAQASDCLGVPCLSLEDPLGPAQDWQATTPAPLPPPAYTAQSNWGVATPARIMQEMWSALTAHGMDPLPWHPDQPHFEFVISVNTGGQEALATGLARQAVVLDDSIAEIWTRRIEFPQAEADWAGLAVGR